MTRISFIAAPLIFTWALLANTAFAEYQWIGQITEDGAALSYAIPNSDGIKIDFHCDRKSKNIIVNYEHEPERATDGIRLKLAFSLKGLGATPSVNIAATGQRLELDDKFVVQGETRMSPQLRRILSDEGILLIAAGDRVEEIPLKGVVRANKQLFASCP